jgi:hypothetical protein
MIALALVLVLTPSAVFLARWIRLRAALPVLTAIAGYFPFVLAAQSSFVKGFLLLLIWTIILSAIVLRLSWIDPEQMESIIWRAKEYTSSMFQWIETGTLPEGSAKQVLLFHLKQTFIYCVVALLTANFFSLILGSALLNYMNFYVARLARSSSHPTAMFFIGWNPWSVVRVLSFLYLGMSVSTLPLMFLFAIPWRYSWSLFLPGVAGIVIDILCKIFLSERWRIKLKDAMNRAPTN